MVYYFVLLYLRHKPQRDCNDSPFAILTLATGVQLSSANQLILDQHRFDGLNHSEALSSELIIGVTLDGSIFCLR